MPRRTRGRLGRRTHLRGSCTVVSFLTAIKCLSSVPISTYLFLSVRRTKDRFPVRKNALGLLLSRMCIRGIEIGSELPVCPVRVSCACCLKSPGGKAGRGFDRESGGFVILGLWDACLARSVYVYRRKRNSVDPFRKSGPQSEFNNIFGRICFITFFFRFK